MSSRPGLLSSRLARVLLASIAVIALVAAVPATRTIALRMLGGLLIVSDPIERPDIAAITIESGEAGELEVSDLYRDQLFPRVLVLAPEPTVVARDLARPLPSDGRQRLRLRLSRHDFRNLTVVGRSALGEFC
jgi:hypothetical protein